VSVKTRARFCSSRAAAPSRTGQAARARAAAGGGAPRGRAAPASPPRCARPRPRRRRCWRRRRPRRRRPNQSPRARAPPPRPSAGAAPRRPRPPPPPRRRPAPRRPPLCFQCIKSNFAGCLGAAEGYGGRHTALTNSTARGHGGDCRPEHGGAVRARLHTSAVPKHRTTQHRRWRRKLYRGGPCRDRRLQCRPGTAALAGPRTSTPSP